MFLDLAKAFDKVPYQRLCHKLSHYRISENLLIWIQDFLNNRYQTVVLEGEHSTSCRVLSGVPQGTILAPLLFLIYINDIPSSIANMLRLYAVDALLYSTIDSPADCMTLQTDLLTLQKCTGVWQMQFNPAKCEHLQITSKHNFIDSHYTLYGHTIQKVTNAKYLGVIFDRHLSWKHHINAIAAKATAALAFLQRNTAFCPKELKIHCYNMFVRPIMEYSATAWLPHTILGISKLERVQRRATRYVFNDFSPFQCFCHA